MEYRISDNNQMLQPQRKDWLDFLRGMAMLLVIWGHIAKTEDMFFVVTSPFKMPLFFAITGYVFSIKTGKILPFLKKLFFSIVIPWILLSLIWLKPLYLLITGRPELIGKELSDFVSGSNWWYMPCIIIAEMIQFAVRKLISNKTWQYIAMAAIALLGVFLGLSGGFHYAMLDVACVGQVFMLFGTWFRDHEEGLREKAKGTLLLGLCLSYGLLIVLSCVLYPGQSLDVHNNFYYNYLICGLMIFISMLTLFLYTPKIKKYPAWLLFVGKSTMAFYIVHYYVRGVFAKGLSVLRINLPKNLIGYFVEFVFVCAVMTVIAMILDRWFPFAVGKAKKRSKE